MNQTVAVISGGRADYGLLKVLLSRLQADPLFVLRVIVTGQHLVGGNAATAKIVEADGFTVAESVPILAEDDSERGTALATGRAVIGLTEALARLAPDLVIVLGDRYEILAGALAAHILRMPIAHLMGGDVTQGAIDDAFRHSVTKLSHLHFVSTPSAAARVRQLGEDPARIHLVGSPGLDLIAAIPRLDREALLAELGLQAPGRLLLVTFHPVTAEADSDRQMAELLAALQSLPEETALIVTGVNADANGRALERQVMAFCAGRPNAIFHASLGSRLYFSALAHSDAVVGNSSSGLYEAPSFKVPTVNIGTRQAGRVKATSVIDAPPERMAIAKAIQAAFALDCSGAINPYGDGHASDRIMTVLRATGPFSALLAKPFFDLVATAAAADGPTL